MLRSSQGELFVFLVKKSPFLFTKLCKGNVTVSCHFIEETTCQDVEQFDVTFVQYEWPVVMTFYQVKPNVLRSASLTIVQHLPSRERHNRMQPWGYHILKNRSIYTIHSNHCPWQPLCVVTDERAVQVHAREGDTSLRGKPDTARPTPRTLRGLSSPRGPAHYPRLPNYHLMCPDMTNVVDNRWTMRSQPFNTATKWWTGLWPCGSKSDTSPHAHCSPWVPPGSGSTFTLPSMCSFLTAYHAPLVIHAWPRTHIYCMS